jgi:hypothetical protein
MSATLNLRYFNSFWLKKMDSVVAGVSSPDNAANLPRSTGGALYASNLAGNWSIEESRIRGGYNNTSTDYGAKAYLVEDKPNSSKRVNTLIYSGIFNSRTGVNNTNVFSVGEEITKNISVINTCS